MSVADDPNSSALLAPGTRVEVRNGFDRTWSKGFVVEAVRGDGYVLRRRSDRTVLPSLFAAADVRAERRSSMWWI